MFILLKSPNLIPLHQDNVIAHPSTEAEAEVPTVNVIQYNTSPPASVDSVSAHTELSFSTPAPEEINSHGGSAISSGEICFSPNHVFNVCALTEIFLRKCYAPVS
jgi:hypothetical protein